MTKCKQLIQNAGHEPSVLLEEVLSAEGNFGFNVLSEKVEDLLNRSGKNLHELTKKDLTQLLIRGPEHENTADSTTRIIDLETIYGYFKSKSDMAAIDMLREANKNVLIGALLILDEKGKDFSKQNLSEIDIIQANNKTNETRAKEIAKITEVINKARSRGVALSLDDFVLSPLTEKIIPEIVRMRKYATAEISERVAREIADGLKQCAETRINADIPLATLQNIDEIWDVNEAYKKAIDVIGEWKQFAHLMINAFEIKENISILKEKKDISEDEKKVMLNLDKLLKENESVNMTLGQIKKEDLPSKAVESKFFNRFFREYVERAENLMKLYDQISNEESIENAMNSILTKENNTISGISGAKLPENGNGANDFGYLSRYMQKVRDSLNENRRRYGDGGELGRQISETLANFEKLNFQFTKSHDTLKTTYRDISQNSAGESYEKLNELIRGTKSKLTDLIQGHNNSIRDITEKEKEILKQTYLNIESFNFTALLSNLKSILEKIKLSAEKQTDENNRLKSYHSINELQRKIGGYILRKAPKELEMADGIAEREFIEHTAFYFRDIIGETPKNGVHHTYNPVYEALCKNEKLSSLEEIEMILKDLLCFEKLKSRRIIEAKQPIDNAAESFERIKSAAEKFFNPGK